MKNTKQRKLKYRPLNKKTPLKKKKKNKTKQVPKEKPVLEWKPSSSKAKTITYEGFTFWLYIKITKPPYLLRLDEIHGADLGEFSSMEEVNEKVLAYVKEHK